MGLGAEYGRLADRSDEYVGGTITSNGFSGLNVDTPTAVSLHLGYNVEVKDFVLGVEAKLRKGTAENKDFQLLSGLRTPDFSTSYDSDTSWQIVGRAGVRVGTRGLAYAALGLAGAKVTRGYYSSSAPDGEFFSGTDTGTVIGLGYGHMMSGQWSMRVEVTRIEYNRVTHTPVAAWSSLDDTHRAQSTSLSLSITRHF